VYEFPPVIGVAVVQSLPAARANGSIIDRKKAMNSNFSLMIFTCLMVLMIRVERMGVH
jgi:hypothetical protein